MMKTATETPEDVLAKEAVKTLYENKGRDIRLLELSEISTFADYFVIASTDSHIHLRALSKKIQDTMVRHGYKLKHAEGLESKSWILLDFNTIIIHLFSLSAREYYGIEHLWGDAIEISIDEIVNVSSVA